MDKYYSYILKNLLMHDEIKYLKEVSKEYRTKNKILILGSLNKTIAKIIRKEFYTADIVFTEQYHPMSDKVKIVQDILPQATIAYPLGGNYRVRMYNHHEIVSLDGRTLKTDYSLIIDVGDDILAHPYIRSRRMIEFYPTHLENEIDKNFLSAGYTPLQKVTYVGKDGDTYSGGLYMIYPD